MSKEEIIENSSENENVSSEATNWEEVAMALAKDLVEMSTSIRSVLANSAFNYNAIDEVRLLESMTRQVLETYVSNNEEESKQEENKES